MNSQTGSTLEIPLKKLVAWNGNVRRTKTDQGIKELAASIAAYGLLQNLVFKKAPRGQYAVVAGERRLLAMIQLAESGTYKWTTPVLCLLTDSDAPHTEIGLAENIVREDMHPVEQFQAFLQLINQGQSVADIAARFGVAEGVVNRRLALARVSPLLLQKYREGEMNLELLQAFTLTDDHAAQDAVWHQLQPWSRKAQTVRQMLSHDDIPAHDKQVRFVGLDTYEAEGGAVRRDLFAKGEEGTYVSDPATLSRLVDVKLQSIADGLQREGWKWVMVQPDLDLQAIGRFRRLQPTPVPLSKASAKKLTKLEGKLEELQAQLAGDENGDEDILYQQIEALEDAIEKIHRNQTGVYDDATKTKCGVVVSIAQNGQPELTYGLLRKEDEIALVNSEETSSETASAQAAVTSIPEPETNGYSAALTESLTQHKTAAIAVEFTQQPNVALAAVVHTFMLRHFHLDLDLYNSETSIQISTTETQLGAALESPTGQSLTAQHRNWLAVLPRSSSQLWQWCLAQDQPTLLRLLAFCAATAINGVCTNTDAERNGRLQHVDLLATALHVDLAKWFTPTTENCFSRISKAQITQALQEAGTPLNRTTLTMKKNELAAVAEAKIAGTGWLPAPMRIQARP